MNQKNTKTAKKNIIELWESCRGLVLPATSFILVAVMAVCLLVNSGIAERIAKYSEGIYIVTAIWFAVIAFRSCKYLRGKSDCTVVSTRGAHISNTKGE